MRMLRGGTRTRLTAGAAGVGASGGGGLAQAGLGGPACAVATVEAMSQLRVDHFIRLDFNGFRKMSLAAGLARLSTSSASSADTASKPRASCRAWYQVPGSWPPA